MQKNERVLLLTLAALNFTNIMDFMIMMPLGPQLMRIFDISPKQFGIIVSSYTISAGISGFCSAFLIDKFDRKTALSFLYTGFIIGTFMCGLAPNYEMLLFARIFTGIFGGVMGAVVLSIVGDVIPVERRGQAMGTLMAAFSVASVFGVPFGLFIATHSELGWHAPFLFLAICGLPVAYFIYKYVPSINKQIEAGKDNNPWQIIKNVTSTKNQLWAMLLMIMIMMGHFAIIPFLSPYMVSNLGFQESQLPLIYMIGGAFTIFSSPLIGKAADKYGKLNVFIVFIILCTIPVLTITNMPKVPIYYVLGVTSLFFVFSGGRMIPAQAMVTSSVNPMYRGSFMSITSALQQLSAGFASYIAGVLVHKDTQTGQLEGYHYVGLFSVTLTLLSIFIAVKVRTFDGNRI